MFNMGRKRIIKIPKTAGIKCPHCLQISRVKVPEDASLPFFECKKCEQKVSTPLASCCIICAFSNKRCYRSLMMEAHAKKLEIRMPAASRLVKEDEMTRLLFPNRFKA